MDSARAKPARRTFGEFVKDVVLFLAAPFVSLTYVGLFPFIGIAMLARTLQERRKRPAHLS
jgi:hypothetical protein